MRPALVAWNTDAKKSVKSPIATGNSIRACAIGVRCGRSPAGSPCAVLKARDSASRSADQACGPSDMRGLRTGIAQARAASAASPPKDAPAAATSRT